MIGDLRLSLFSLSSLPVLRRAVRLLSCQVLLRCREWIICAFQRRSRVPFPEVLNGGLQVCSVSVGRVHGIHAQAGWIAFEIELETAEILG